MIAKYRVVLASASPRRKELLGKLFDSFEVIAADVHEEAFKEPEPRELAAALARAKALVVYLTERDSLVVGADTVVALGRQTFGKPANAREAQNMLLQLADKTHSVFTGVHILWPEGERGFVEETKVTFRALSSEEIESYAATDEPRDKAGGYAIQGAGAKLVEKIDGDYDNVVGLPMKRLAEELRSLKIAE